MKHLLVLHPKHIGFFYVLQLELYKKEKHYFEKIAYFYFLLALLINYIDVYS